MRPNTMRWRNAALVSSLLAGLASSPVAAEPVSTDHLGLELHANLELPNGTSFDTASVTLIVHGTLSHYGSETIAGLQKALAAKGQPSLAINLSLGLDKRQGAYDCKLEHDHRQTDAPDEIAEWINWLRSRNARSVLVAGHSRGAAQVAQYAAKGADALVGGLVLIAPPAGEPDEIAAAYKASANQDLAPLITMAERQIERDEGDGFIEVPLFLGCRKARVTAEAFIDYYAAPAENTTIALLRKIDRQTLVVTASADDVASGLPAKLAAAKLASNITFSTIDGADHFFRDLFADDLADAIVAFKAKLPAR